MSNGGWKATIQSGNADIDLQMLDRHRQSAQQQGLVLHGRNMQNGGFEVAAAPMGAPSPFDTPQSQTMPSNYALAAMGYGPPMPAPRMVQAPQVAWAPQQSVLFIAGIVKRVRAGNKYAQLRASGAF